MSDPKPQTPTQGKKKKKAKWKKIVALAHHEFLADKNIGRPVVEPAKRTKSWDDETDEIDHDDISTAWDDDRRDRRNVFDLSKLPTAPRSAQQAAIDLSRLPKHPPYTLFLGNLSYDATEEHLTRFFEDRNVKVANIRLLSDALPSRPKGFGYAEFAQVDDLIAALQLNSEMVSNRPIRIDLANTSDDWDDDDRGGGYGRRFNQDESSDWRRPDDDDQNISTAWDDDQRDRRASALSKLPTAPRSAQQVAIDLSRLPKHPPYTAFIGNLSYDATEEHLTRFFEDRNVKVANIRLPLDALSSRPKGFGYAEFAQVDDLTAALQLNSEMVFNRPIRIDLTNTSDGGDEDRGGGYGQRFHQDESSDWRRPDDDDRGGGYGWRFNQGESSDDDDQSECRVT